MKMRTALVVSLVVVAGCKLLNKAAEGADAGATADAGPTTATTDTVTASASAAPSAATAKAATATTAHKTDAGPTAGKTMTAPSPTTDRMPRNRDKDGACPTGFTEQPGVENHSTCARNCKTEADCHGHTCEDSMISDGKVCSDTASKPKPARAKCKADEIDDGDACYKQCTKDTDCTKPKTCQQMRVPNPNGGTSTAMVCNQ
jgi:hypothetical protein